MVIQLKGDQLTHNPKLDRVVQFDERSRQYPIRELVGAKPPRSYSWSVSKTLDQGNEGACVGFSWATELIARPVRIPGVDNDFGRKIYHKAQTLDEWPGEDYQGTSVLAGAKAVQGMGFMTEYRWGFGLEDLVLAVGYAGPAVLGLNWYSGMMRTDLRGWIHPTGGVEGGHAILARSVHLILSDKSKDRLFENLDMDKSFITLHNSWSATWGVGGDCLITLADLDRLLHEQGEACIPVHRLLKEASAIS